MGYKVIDDDIKLWFKANLNNFYKILSNAGMRSQVQMKCNKCNGLYAECFDFIKSSKPELITLCRKCRNGKNGTNKNKPIQNGNIDVIQKYYVYRFLDINNNIIYIGKTNDLLRRMKEHFGNYGHLPIECYNATNKIDFIILNNEIDMNIYELYYINMYKPQYNDKDKLNSSSDLTLPNKSWRCYKDSNNNTNTYSFNKTIMKSLKNNILDLLKNNKPKKILNNYEGVIIIDYTTWKNQIENILNEVNNIESLILDL